MKFSLFKLIGQLRLYLFVFSLVPVILLNTISIIYADQLNNFTRLDNLSSYYSLLNSDIDLPLIIVKLGTSYISTIYVLFTVWFLLFTLYAYLILSEKKKEWLGLTIEIFTISFVYFYFLCPDVLLYYILGVIGTLILIALISLYLILHKKRRDYEKR